MGRDLPAHDLPVSVTVHPDWCRTIEIQPPYLYRPMKAVMAGGASDFAMVLSCQSGYAFALTLDPARIGRERVWPGD